MRKNHRPYALKKFNDRFRRFWINHFLRPQFDSLGVEPNILSPRHLVLCGPGIHVGDHAHFICAADNHIRLTTWPHGGEGAEIRIGNFCLLSPGTRISAAQEIVIGNNCMFAANCYVSDSDWHGIYNRTRPFRCTSPVRLADNVWLGEGTIVCKGVQIGENSVIGAGSVVTRDIPANVVAAGNPAKVIKSINPARHMLRREHIFRPQNTAALGALDEQVFAGNTWRGWLRSMLFPGQDD